MAISNIRIWYSQNASKRFTEVKEWDNGYIVVMADYEGIGETEEYIDLLPILKNLYIKSYDISQTNQVKLK